MHFNNLKTKLLLAIMSAFLALAMGEIVLRMISPPNPFNSIFPLYPHRVRVLEVSHQNQPPTLIHQSHNKWGLRGDEPPQNWSSACTVLAVGGSTTECYYLDDQNTWPYLLQENLKATIPDLWVGNAGLDGHSTRGHRIFMQDVVAKIHPKVILFLVGINDLALCLRGKDDVYDRPGNWRWKLFNRFRISQMLYNGYLILFRHVAVPGKVNRFYLPQTLTNPKPLPQDLRNLIPLLPEYEANIHQLIAMSRAMGSIPIFLTQPMLFEDTPYWRSKVGRLYWVQNESGELSAATFAKLLNIYNQKLLEICKQDHVECFDLAAVIPHDVKYFDDAVHFNIAGAALVGEKVASYFNAEKLCNDVNFR